MQFPDSSLTVKKVFSLTFSLVVGTLVFTSANEVDGGYVSAVYVCLSVCLSIIKIT